MTLLETAAGSDDRAAVRTAAAAVFALSDLIQIPPGKIKSQAAPPVAIAVTTNQPCTALSHNGLWTAVARDVDGLNGSVELIQTTNGGHLATIERKQFPWIPVPEAGLLSFSPDDKLLTIGGPATSRHVLICNVPDGALKSYLFHGSDPLCCGWHSGGRLLAVGCADGTVRIWDTEAAVSPKKNLVQTNQFDLPPNLDVPAQDVPVQVLPDHRGAVRHLTFSSTGEWLASLDALGYLQIHTGFPRAGGLRPPSQGRVSEVVTALGAASPGFAVEIRLADVNQVTALGIEQDRVLVRRGTLPPQEFQFVPSEFPAESPVAPGLNEIALNAQGTELCAITPTDIHWLRTTPLEDLQRAAGQNPRGVCGQRKPGSWLIAKDRQLMKWDSNMKDAMWPKSMSSGPKLSEAVAGQGTLTAISSCGDYRVAAYYGRRIQFVLDMRLAALSNSITANGGEGIFQEIFWDTPGRLLGAVFKLQSGALRLEAWETSTNFPPDYRGLSATNLDCQRIIPAEDGKHCIARGGSQGLYLFDPATGIEITLDTSSIARQDAPLACTPDGSLLAIVADRNMVRLLALPSGKRFADLYALRQSELMALTWDATNRHLAATSRDGYVQVWNLGPWQAWLARHGLLK